MFIKIIESLYGVISTNYPILLAVNSISPIWK